LQFSPKPKRRVIINITSLIDVLFLLLIFFMVTSTFLEHPGMKLELPSAENSETTRVEEPVLYIGSKGEIMFNDQVIPLDSLENVMKNTITLGEDKTLILRADKTVQHGIVVRVMDIAKRVGMSKLVIGTKMKGE
jgi:biopolymer transport protein ExbD